MTPSKLDSLRQAYNVLRAAILEVPLPDKGAIDPEGMFIESRIQPCLQCVGRGSSPAPS